MPFTQTLLVALGILDPLYVAFGWFMRLLYHVFANYGVVIIVFTIFFRAIMIPLYVKQHKTSLLQGQLRDEMNELQRRYADDKQGFSMAQMELYKQHKISMFSGCLPQLLGLVLIWPVWRIISSPLRYILGVPLENLRDLATQLGESGLLSAPEIQNIERMDIPILQVLMSNGDQLAQAVSKGLIRVDQMINLDFLGLNLGVRPTWQPALLFGEERGTYLPLLLIPIIALLTTILMQRISEDSNPMMAQAKADRKKAERNPARDMPQEQQTESMMKSMKIMMPVMTLMTVFWAPAAMGVYWIVGNLMAMLQSYLLYRLYTKPVQQQIAEIEERARLGIAAPAIPASAEPES
ncbi:MAG: membrane protein insertase YidC [Bacillota bacterium]|nr:membrane protein insertase YidC [Bacillota bacterium]